jgi:hypothetical protein
VNYLFGLASSLNSPDLCLLSGRIIGMSHWRPLLLVFLRPARAVCECPTSLFLSAEGWREWEFLNGLCSLTNCPLLTEQVMMNTELFEDSGQASSAMVQDVLR